MGKNILTKFLLIVFALVLIITLVACGSNPNGQNTNPDTDENLQTEKQVWLPYTMLDHFENCKYTYYYDEYGNEIKKTKENSSGILQSSWLSEYDDRQNLIKRSVDTGDGAPFVQLIQTYDDKGNLIEQQELKSIYTYQYDEQNRLISKSNGGEVIETYTYEEDGSYKAQKEISADEYSIYGADGKIKERRFDSDTKWVYSYNTDNVLIECIAYSGENITQKTVYHLDENGNTIKITRESASGNETVMSEYEYKLYTVKVK